MNKILFPFVLLLAACAYSPQQISINPTVSSSGESYGKGFPVMVTAEDGRASKVLGSRGGIYRDTSTITVANSLEDAIGRAAISKLAAQGFSVNTNDSNAAQVNIVIDELVYDKPEDALDKKIYLEAVLRVEASYQGKSFTSNYKTKTQKAAIVTPSSARNEAMINELLSATLERLFADKKLQNFLTER